MQYCSGRNRQKLFSKLWLFAAVFWMMVPVGLWPAMGQPVPRKVLALYKSSEKRTAESNEIAQRMQLVLNNLGFVVEYADAEGVLPPPDALADYRGIISYFYNEDMRHARRYRAWLKSVIQAGNKVVMFGNMGAYREWQRAATPKDQTEVRAIFKLLGLIPPTRYHGGGSISIRRKDEQFFDYECKLNKASLGQVSNLKSVSPRNRVLLTLAAPHFLNDAVILGPWGGLVETGLDFHLDDASGIAQWYLNPFLFLQAALGSSGMPVADLNTLGGHRLAFAHIDGDGFSTISKIDRWNLCANLVKKYLLRGYEMPFSTSVITAEVDSNIFGNRMTMKIAREIFALPNVEPASHSFAHPFNWRTGKVAFDSIPGYRFDARREIISSMQFIQNTLVPAGKPVQLFFWSGMCNPTPGQIEMVEQPGWLQLNGRAGLLDPKMPSISSFAPPYTQVGHQFRINARISNEYEFTHHWQPPYRAYEDLIQTLKFTGNGPLTPANIYLHYYIMEWPESWHALKNVMKWVAHQDWSFVYTSDYINMVKDFMALKVTRLSRKAFSIENRGCLRTVRFPGEGRPVDLAASQNVVGYLHQNHELVVHLDGHYYHKIVLQKASTSSPYLSTFNMLVDSVRRVGETLELEVRGYGKFLTRVQHLLPHQFYQVLTYPQSPGTGQQAKPKAYASSFLRSNKQGVLTLQTQVRNHARIIIQPASTLSYLEAKTKLLVLIAIFGLSLVWFRRSNFDFPGLPHQFKGQATS